VGAAAFLLGLFDSSAWVWVAGVILFESTTFFPPPIHPAPGVKTFEATGRLTPPKKTLSSPGPAR
ncbi:hypothetical protein, partial [Phragmitibacter flavus]|uniref:hypothetical protein n=1 Tax=Phragmitibacter flavus TaxID=2576071 RepID=UPI0019804FAC